MEMAGAGTGAGCVCARVRASEHSLLVCVEQTAGAQRRVGWALAADELTPGSEGARMRQRSVVRV